LSQDVVIQTEDEIRVKIVGTRVDATDIVSELHILNVISLVWVFYELLFNSVTLILLFLYHLIVELCVVSLAVFDVCSLL